MIEKILTLIENWTNSDDVDIPVLEYMIESETQRVLNDIHHKVLPEELEHVIVYRVAGSFLRANIDKLVGADELQTPTSLKMGDTQINFTGKSKGDVLNELITNSMTYGSEELSCYRRIKW